jgi:hypothetical protein
MPLLLCAQVQHLSPAFSDWALRVLGKTNGTMIEAMVQNGTVLPLTADRITEVRDAQREAGREHCVGDECSMEVAVEPFPHEAEIMSGAAGAPPPPAAAGKEAAAEPAAAAGANSTAA